MPPFCPCATAQRPREQNPHATTKKRGGCTTPASPCCHSARASMLPRHKPAQHHRLHRLQPLRSPPPPASHVHAFAHAVPCQAAHQASQPRRGPPPALPCCPANDAGATSSPLGRWPQPAAPSHPRTHALLPHVSGSAFTLSVTPCHRPSCARRLRPLHLLPPPLRRPRPCGACAPAAPAARGRCC